jgi:hypothetical protein
VKNSFKKYIKNGLSPNRHLALRTRILGFDFEGRGPKTFLNFCDQFMKSCVCVWDMILDNFFFLNYFIIISLDPKEKTCFVGPIRGKPNPKQEEEWGDPVRRPPSQLKRHIFAYRDICIASFFFYLRRQPPPLLPCCTPPPEIKLYYSAPPPQLNIKKFALHGRLA